MFSISSIGKVNFKITALFPFLKYPTSYESSYVWVYVCIK